jgi:hypothetical protein
MKVCDDGKLVQILRSWTLSVVLSLSKMWFCLPFKTQHLGDWILSPTQLGPIERASPYLRTSLRNFVLKHEQDDILDKDETMDNVQERNICNKCIIVLSSPSLSIFFIFSLSSFLFPPLIFYFFSPSQFPHFIVRLTIVSFHISNFLLFSPFL